MLEIQPRRVREGLLDLTNAGPVCELIALSGNHSLVQCENHEPNLKCRA
jgi:hypothetical protein